ncbi:MAG: leucine-rich repeat domain-containing protein, partial [Prevotella sp.]|nr:leucine-rich repeat domain-containing protein [Prevotella sp.]
SNNQNKCDCEHDPSSCLLFDDIKKNNIQGCYCTKNGADYFWSADNKLPEIFLLEALQSLPNICDVESDTSIICCGAFRNFKNLTNVVLHEELKKIGCKAFEGCSNLTDIIIPNSVTYIGSSAFKGCTSLKSINIPNGVTEICDSTFANCTGLTSVTIPDSVTKIGCYAFKGCTNISKITIGSGVTEFDTGAFYNCSGLKNILLKCQNPSKIARSYTFDNVNKYTCNIHVPNGCKSKYSKMMCFSNIIDDL